MIECPHAERCGGCPLIDRDYSAGLAAKQATLAGALSRFADIGADEPRSIRPAPSIIDYRVRAKLAVSRTRIGLYAASTHDVVDIPHCLVLAPAIRDVVATIRQQAAHPPAESAAVFDALVALDVREVMDEHASVLVTLVLDASCELSRAQIGSAAQAIQRAAPVVVGVTISRRKAGSAQLLGTGHEAVAGVARAPDRIGAVRHFATPGAFVQTHRAQAAALHAELVRLLRESLGDLANKRGIDLYAGSGAIGLALAHAGLSMRLVESFPPAADAAREAAKWLPPGRVEVVTGDASRVAQQLVRAGDKPDVVVVNPPRRGLSPLAREAVAAAAPRAAAYVSCNPETLARDLDHLARLGLRTSVVQPFDMIPLTEEIETLALLVPGPAPALRVLFEDASLLVIDKPPHEPAVRLLQRVRARPGWERAVALYDLDPGASGAAAFSKVGDDAVAKRLWIVGARGIAPAKGVVNRPLRGAAARTRYRRLSVVHGHSVLRVEAEPGRPQQIQRHLAGIGHPVLGDAQVGHAATNRHLAERHGIDRTVLHCGRVELDHPATGRRLIVDSPLAGDLLTFLERGDASLPALS